MGFQEVEHKLQDHAGADGLLWPLASLGFATIIVDAVYALFLLLFVLGDDARAHWLVAIETMHKATEKIGLCGLLFLHRLDHLERRADVREFVDGKEVVHGDNGLEVEQLGEVDDGTTKHMHARIARVAEHDGGLVDGHGVGFARLVVGRGAGVAAFIHKLRHLLLRLSFGSQRERAFYQNPIVAVGSQVPIRVFVVAVLGGVDALAFLDRPALPTLHDFAQMVAVLLGEHKRDAKEHFAHRRILKAECSKGQVLDYLLVEEVDYLSRISHVASETVRMPRQNGIVLSALDVLDHLSKKRADVGLLCALLLFDDFDVFDGNTEPFCGIQTIRDLVGDAPLLPFVGRGGLAGVEDETERFDVYFARILRLVKRHECVIEVFGRLHRNRPILSGFSTLCH